MYTYSKVYLDITSFTWISQSSWCVANSGFALWNFMQFFSPNIFKPQLVESFGNIPVDKEDQLYKGCCYFILSLTLGIVCFLLYLFQ